MIKIHAIVGGKFKSLLQEHEFFKLIRGLLEKTRDNLTSTSVKVVPLTVTSMQNKFQQKIFQLGCTIAQKLLTMRCFLMVNGQ
jgi:hypothetical protein